MSDQRGPDMGVQQTRFVSWKLAWAMLRGLAIGLASTTAGALVGFAIIKWMPVEPCNSDLGCLPDLGPLILAACALPVVVASVGPPVARLFRMPRPWLYAVPAAWTVVLVCVGLGGADGQNRWPFNDAVSILLIQWIPYGLIALWIFRQQRNNQTPQSKRLAAPESDS